VARLKLAQLEPALYIIESPRLYRRTRSLWAADGIWFLCPKCFQANGGRVGTHQVACWRPRVPQTISPTPGRWEFQGTSLKDLSLVAGSSSILLTSGCQAHFFVTNGEILGV
jgi:hypothetical protein